MSEPIWLNVEGRRLEATWYGDRDAGPPLVLLHDGLGSVSSWGEFPGRLAARTGCPVFAYSRAGYGRSSAADVPRRVDFMHDEARLLQAICADAGIRRAILVGHSDGASIALLFAASPEAGAPRLDGLALMAPHVMVEDVTVRRIAELRQLVQIGLVLPKLSRHHSDPRHTFESWCDIWLAPGFRSWNIEAALPAIDLPLLLVQGDRDEFGTALQLDAIERAVRGPVTRRMLADCRHSPHRDAPEETLAAVAEFVGSLP